MIDVTKYQSQDIRQLAIDLNIALGGLSVKQTKKKIERAVNITITLPIGTSSFTVSSDASSTTAGTIDGDEINAGEVLSFGNNGNNYFDAPIIIVSPNPSTLLTITYTYFTL